MLLPTKHLSSERALLSVAGRLKAMMSRPMTPAELWETYQKQARADEHLTYDWFVLALDVLYAIGLVRFNGAVLEDLRDDS
jgi:hypothetical protein